MNSCELVVFISTWACAIRKSCGSEKSELLAAIFTQLGDTLATINAQEAFCHGDEEPEDNNE